MNEAVCFFARFADEETYLRDGDVEVVALDGASFPSGVNLMLPRIEHPYVVLLDGALVGPRDVAACCEVLSDEVWAASPFVPRQPAYGPWWETISPWASVLETETLRSLGGLDERVTFGWHRLLAAEVLKRGKACSHVGQAKARQIASPARVEKLGLLYYRQIEDDDTVRSILNG